MTTQELIKRLKDVAEWKQIIEQHRRKTDDPSITYVLKDGTRVHEDESVIAKLAASLSDALEDASTVATEAAALIRAQAVRVKVLAGVVLSTWLMIFLMFLFVCSNLDDADLFREAAAQAVRASQR